MSTAQNGSQHSTTSVSDSGTNYIDSLLEGVKWGGALGTGTALTYSFPWLNGANAYWASNPFYSSLNEPSDGFALSAGQQSAAKAALTAWSNVANITFTQISETQSSVGDIRTAWTNKINDGAWGWSGYPSDYWSSAGDVWISSKATGSESASYWQAGGYGFEALMHEYGHSLGLKHPFEDSPNLPLSNDNRLYTLMSYTEPSSTVFVNYTQSGNSYSYTYSNVNPDTPMLYDIAAIQYLYGANKSYHSGNDVYTFDPSKPFIRTIWDGGGEDTISTSNFSLGCQIDLRSGYFSKIAIHSNPPSGVNWTSSPPVSTYDTSYNLAIAYNCVIENAIGGSGDDVLVGNNANNKLTGGIGNDVINGGAGLDTSIYSGKFIQYRIEKVQGKVTDLQTNRDGVDTLTNVERLRFSDTNVAFDSAKGEIAGEAYRIYKAAFDRAPDSGGLGFWIDAMDDGATLTSVAKGFINSPEFQKLYGANVSNKDYVTKLYNNVLDRNPDQGGYDFWLGALAKGATREDILVNFSESNENIANVANLIANGIQYQEWLG